MFYNHYIDTDLYSDCHYILNELQLNRPLIVIFRLYSNSINAIRLKILEVKELLIYASLNFS